MSFVNMPGAPLSEQDKKRLDELCRKKRLSEWERGELRGLSVRGDMGEKDKARNVLGDRS